MYKSAQPADQALVKRAALMIEGSTLIPAFSIAITKGLFAAVEERLRDGSLGETSNPICQTNVLSYGCLGLFLTTTYKKGTTKID